MSSKFILLLFLFANAISFAQDDDSWRDSLKIARKAYENKDYSKALKHYESAQKIAPDDVNLSDEMGQSAYNSRDFERAEKIYRQGSSTKMSKRDRGDAMHNLGNAQMKQENYDGAVESYKEALRNNPNDEETRYNLSKAVRKIKELRTPPPKKNNNQQDQQDQNQGGKNQQNQQNQGDKNQQGQKDPNKSGEGNGSSDSSDKGKLTNQMVERTLDDLSKKEAETKRNMMGAGGGGRSAKSGKDW